MHYINIPLKIFIISMAAILSGCYTTKNIREVTPSSGELLRSTLNGTKVPAYLSSLIVRFNGSPTNLNPTFQEEVVEKLRATNLFSKVLGGTVTGGTLFNWTKPDFPVISIRLAKDSTFNQPAEEAIKGIFVGLTAFLLAPAIPNHVEYYSTFQVEVLRWDGQSRTYSSGKVIGDCYTTEFRFPLDEWVSLIRMVEERALNLALNEMVKDSEFFVAPTNSENKAFTK